MLFITGDTHADFKRFNTANFPQQKEMTRDDVVLIMGDFGGVWCDREEERYWLKWLSEKPFTICFVDGNHECMHKDTEVLTSDGWINIKDVYENYEKYKVASVNLDTHALDFSIPIGRVKKYADILIDFNGTNYRQCVTPGHDILVNEQKIKAAAAVEMNLAEHDMRFVVKNSISNEVDISNELIEVLTAIIMDATIVDYKKHNKNSNKVRIQFHFKKLRKIVYVQNLLDSNKIRYTCRTQKDGTTYINIYGDDARFLYGLLGKKKEIPDEWKNLNSSQFRYFINGLINSDATPLINTIVWRTISKKNVDIVTELALRHNWDICVKEMDNHTSGYPNGSLQYHVSLGKEKRIDHKIKIEEIQYNDYTYCLTMKNGTLVTRYKLTPCITGNCFDRLYSNEFETVDFRGGKAHKIRDNIYHLMRGYVFEFEGKKFFAFGGASSHDIHHGILDRDDYKSDDDFKRTYNLWRYLGKSFRVNHISWWKEELPSRQEMEFGLETLEKNNWEVDYVISHCLPQEICSMLGFHTSDSLTIYFNGLIQNKLKFKEWHAGHYHRQEHIMSKFYIHYEDIARIL